MCGRFSYESAQRLNKLDKALAVFKNQQTSDEYAEFIERLTSKERFKSYTAFTEIVTAFEIGEKIGFHNVDFHHQVTTKKKPDIFFKLNDNKGIFLELTALDIGKTEEKIERLLNNLEEYIVQKCQGTNYYISIYFDTSDLIHDEKGNGARFNITRWPSYSVQSAHYSINDYILCLCCTMLTLHIAHMKYVFGFYL